jgi:glycosyltransferase involved in cell wall biosynthesis
MLFDQQFVDDDLAPIALPTSTEGGALRKAVFFAKSLVELAARCVERRRQLFHVHTSWGASFRRKAWVIRIATRLGQPVVLHIHGSRFDSWYRERSERGRRSVRRLFDRCSAVIALSESWKEFLSSITASTVTVVHNAVDADEFAKKRPDPAGGDLRLLLLGGVGLRRKGAFDLLEVCERLVKRDGMASLRLVVAGYGELDEARDFVKTHGLEDNVEVPGWILLDDKARLLRESDVFVLPSYDEGLPIAMLEAMAAGLPVVVSPVGGIPEVVRDGENGLLVPAGDKQALYAALRRLADDPDLRRKLADRGRATIRESFDIRVAAERIKTIYREVLEARRVG